MKKFFYTHKIAARVIALTLSLFAISYITANCQSKQEESSGSDKIVQTYKHIAVKPGIEVLRSKDFAPLKGKRIGLLTNPTGVDRQLNSTIDILHNAKEVNLVALYAPEHGVRGDIYAGGAVKDAKDPDTGLPVYSVYGQNRKPSAEFLKNVDAVVFDIQDIGCRSYTFVSSLGLMMEACAEAGKEFIVLDRPNPLGGERVEGNIVEDGFHSFVSQFKIPYLYGLTLGELALMLNGEKMLSKGVQCKLTVIPMEGWRRKMVYEDTNLPWVLPSPHIPQIPNAYYYPVSGIMGELGYISEGVGYTLPFQLFVAEWIDAAKLSKSMNSLNLPGVRFRPIYITPYYGAKKGLYCGGVQVYITNYAKARLVEIQFLVMQELAKLYPDKKVFENANSKRFRMFDIVCGTDYIRKNFSKNYLWSDVKEYFEKDEAAFKERSKKYYLYK